MNSVRVFLIPLLVSVVALSVVYYFGPYDWLTPKPDESIVVEEPASKPPEESEQALIEPDEEIADESPDVRLMVQVVAGEDPAGQKAAVEAMERFVENRTDSEGRIPWTDPATGETQLFELVRFHDEIFRSENTWLRCASFLGSDGTIVDLDVVVMMRGSGEPEMALLFHQMTVPGHGSD